VANKVAKKKKVEQKTLRILLISAAVVVVLLVIAVVSFLSSSSVHNTDRGNTTGNVMNSGMVVEDANGDIYFNLNGLYRLGADGANQKLADNVFSYMAKKGDWIYYSSYSDGRRLYKYNVQTGEDIKLYDYPAEYINVVDDTVYFASVMEVDTELRGIFSVSTDGGEATRLAGYDSAGMVVYGDRIYFINTSDSRRIYSMDLKGEDRKVVTRANASMMVISDGWIYYCNTEGIYRVRPDGSALRQLSTKSASDMNIAGKKIYHCYVDTINNVGDQKLYCTSTDGSSTEELSEYTAVGMCVAGDYLYFQNVYRSFGFYRIPLAGGEAEQIVDNSEQK